MWHRRIALALAVLAAALLAVSGPGVRLGLWPYRIGLGLFSAALLIGLAAAGAAVVALAMPRLRAGWIPGLIVALLLGAASAAVPLEFLRRLKTVPFIHDITTDTENPPHFVAIVPLRVGALNPHEYQGPHIGELQRIGYPDLRPLELAAPPAQAFARAAALARQLGWEIVGTDESAGRIEAVATTLWFGFNDDVVIRVTPAGSGSRVDVRSKSRVGRGDVGTNARRIREFLARLKNS